MSKAKRIYRELIALRLIIYNIAYKILNRIEIIFYRLDNIIDKNIKLYCFHS